MTEEEQYTVASDALIGFFGDVITMGVHNGNPLPEHFFQESAKALGEFTGGVSGFLRLAQQQRERQELTGQVEAANAEGNPFDFSRQIHEAQARERTAILTSGANTLTGYLKNSPHNPLPFSYSKELAEKLQALGNAVADLGIVLPSNFFPAIKRALISPPGIEKK